MPSSAAAGPLRILHRSYAGDGAKPRPPYFSKLLALVSLLRAADALPVRPELVFLNDGPMPADRLRVMEAHGEVRQVRRGGSDARSYREMLADEAARPGADEDLVWLAEDDYLYAADGFLRLVQAAAALPQADYLMLYGSLALDPAAGAGRRVAVLREGGADHPAAQTADVDGATWFRIASTTSTFGLRRRALREDLRLLRLGALTGGAWDNSSCRMVQGFTPFDRGTLRADLLPLGREPLARWPRSVARGLVRALALPLSRRPARLRRTFMGSDPELAFHMEAGDVPPHPVSTRTSKVDWATVAAESAAWGRERGIPVG
ncbi:MAG: hypothetical protein NTW05_20495 [Pseudonocardiales bacterium]|nr:hypothetical protein [Pseudonocardiales bacterium]